VGEPKWKSLLWRRMCRWKETIKMDLGEIGDEDDGINLG
jgi:hypothetical protein